MIGHLFEVPLMTPWSEFHVQHIAYNGLVISNRVSLFDDNLDLCCHVMFLQTDQKYFYLRGFMRYIIP